MRLYHNILVITLFPVLSPAPVAPLFETQCSYVEATLDHFLSWTQDQAGADVGPFCDYPNSEYWAYADYKYIAMLFQDQPSMFEVIISLLSTYMLRQGDSPCFAQGVTLHTAFSVANKKQYFKHVT